MGARTLLTRLYVRATRRLPPWIRTRRARAFAIGGAVLLVIGAIADVGGVLSIILPQPLPVTAADIDGLKSDLIAEMRAQGVIVDQDAQTALGEGLAFYKRLDSPDAREALKMMATAPPPQTLNRFIGANAAYVKNASKNEAAKAWSALGAVAYPVDPKVALDAYEKSAALNPDEGYTHFRLGVIYQDYGRLDDAETANDRAIELARRDGELVTAALARMHNGVIAKQRSAFDKAEADLLAAADELETLGERYYLAMAYGNLGSLYGAAIGLYPERNYNRNAPETYYNRAMDIGYELGDASIVADSNLGLGTVWRDRGDYFLAIELYSRALGYFEWINEPYNIGQARMNLGLTALALGEHARATSDFETALRIYSDLKQPLNIAVARLELGLAHALAGNLPRACREFTEAGRIFTDVGGVTAYADIIGEMTARACNNQPVDPDRLQNWAATPQPRSAGNPLFPEELFEPFDVGAPPPGQDENAARNAGE